MSFSPDGKKLAWVGEDEKTFALWDVATGEQVLQFRGSPDRVESVHFSPDGKRIAAVYSDSDRRASAFRTAGRSASGTRRRPRSFGRSSRPAAPSKPSSSRRTASG